MQKEGEKGMRKKVALIISLIMISFIAFAGCSKDPAKTLINSIEKTAVIDKCTETVDFDMKINAGENLKTGNETDAQIAALFSNIKGTFNVKSDRTGKAMYCDGNLGMGGINVNTKMYMKDNKIAMQIPMFPKYLVVDMSKYEKDKKQDSKAQAELSKKILDILKKSLSKDKVTLTDNKKINTINGDVNVSEITVKYTDEDIKNIMSQFTDVVYSDNTFKSHAIDNLKKSKNGQGLSEADLNKMLEDEIKKFKDELKNVEFKDFVYTADIDKNSYIIQQKISFKANDLSGEAKGSGIEVNMTTKTTDIGKDINFEMPKLDETNSMNIEDLNSNDGLNSNIN